ncbi:MAG: hypothetical protein JJ916_12315 [Phycisphaerales bacterium]|nr:hypothetical protein [Phycisphaerales bacterium]
MTDKSEYVKQLNQRHAALAWWSRVQQEHPWGVVPIPTAARILAVSTRRVHELVKEGRFQLIEGMPGGNERDRFIPIADLLDAPFRMTRGRPGVFGPKNRQRKKYEESIYDYSKSLAKKGLR